MMQRLKYGAKAFRIAIGGEYWMLSPFYAILAFDKYGIMSIRIEGDRHKTIVPETTDEPEDLEQ